MNLSKIVIIVALTCFVQNAQARKHFCAVPAKAACVQEECVTEKRCALKPRTRRAQCPPPEYGLDCDSCCYQAYTTPSFYGNAFRPFYGDGYFGRRPGNFNFAW